MIKRLMTVLIPGVVVFAAGCATLEPPLPGVNPQIAPEWPLPETSLNENEEEMAADIGWRDFFGDEKLRELISLALENNRDLRTAVLNIERARAQYRINRSEKYPSVGASGRMVRSRGNAGQPRERYSVELGVAEYEIDLFGRIRNLSEAALQRFFATEEARRSAQLALIAEVANTYLVLSADLERQRIANAMLENFEEEFALTEERFRRGAVSALDLSQSRTIVQRARADVARFEGEVAEDLNALTLLVGVPVEKRLLPEEFRPDLDGIRDLPVGLPSEVLLRRPDVLQAEFELLAANANIGAARAAFFPSIRLTGAVGLASSELDGLFDSGSDTWSFSPVISLPIFQGGRLRANRDVAIADRDIALARYERAIQVGFREVADALALTDTLMKVRGAVEELVAAAQETHDLSQVRYQAGQDSYLLLLDAQRTLFSARQELVATQLAVQTNRVNLYRVLGGGWRESSE